MIAAATVPSFGLPSSRSIPDAHPVRQLDYFLPSVPTNILILGPSKSGKSSLVNTLFSTSTEVGNVIRGIGSATFSFNRYSVNDDVSVFDTWACDLSTDSRSDRRVPPIVDLLDLATFRRILDGKLADKSTCDTNPNYRKVGENIIHAVVFVLPVSVRNGILQDRSYGFKRFQFEDINPAAQLRRHLVECRRRGLPAIVAVTKIDEYMNNEVLPKLGLTKRFDDDREVSIEDIQMLSPARKAVNLCRHHVHFGEQVSNLIRGELSDSSIPILPFVNYDPNQGLLNPIPFVQELCSEFVQRLTSLIRPSIEPLSRPKEFVIDVFRNEQTVELHYRPFGSQVEESSSEDEGEERDVIRHDMYDSPLDDIPILGEMEIEEEGMRCGLKHWVVSINSIPFRFFIVGFHVKEENDATDEEEEEEEEEEEGEEEEEEEGEDSVYSEEEYEEPEGGCWVQIVGLWNPVTSDYFEVLSPDGALNTRIEVSFGPSFLPYYDFLDENWKGSMECLPSTVAVRLSLEGGNYPLVLKRTTFGRIHGQIENDIQITKKIEENYDSREGKRERL